jgi:prepilin-type N-terminal cleavage/methylation domain-containing protein/prepilin-type processing-associated H-X9-DG protein
METKNFTPSSTARKRGFTLIELLTVIAIIAVLSGILIPAMRSVRAKAHQAECQSNLRQIGVALNLYLQNNNNEFPGPLVAKQNTFYKEGVSNSLLSYLVPYLELPPSTGEKQFATIFSCPAVLAEQAIEDEPKSYLIPTHHASGYLFGYARGEETKQFPKNMNFAYQKSQEGPVWILRDRGESSATGEVARHPDGHNVLFLDGSVQALPPEEIVVN